MTVHSDVLSHKSFKIKKPSIFSHTSKVLETPITRLYTLTTTEYKESRRTWTRLKIGVPLLGNQNFSHTHPTLDYVSVYSTSDTRIDEC